MGLLFPSKTCFKIEKLPGNWSAWQGACEAGKSKTSSSRSQGPRHGGLLQSEAVVREALAWEEGTGTGTDLCCEPFAYMSNAHLKQQASSVWKVKTYDLVDDEGGAAEVWSAVRDGKDLKCSKWTSVQWVWRVVKGSHGVHCIKSGMGKYQGNHWVLRKEWLRTDHLQIGEIVSKWTNDTSKCKFSEITH